MPLLIALAPAILQGLFMILKWIVQKTASKEQQIDFFDKVKPLLRLLNLEGLLKRFEVAEAQLLANNKKWDEIERQEALEKESSEVNILVERPNVNEVGAGLLWYPEAKISSEKMKTMGKYKTGYPRGAIVHFTAGRQKSDLSYGTKMGYCYLLINGDGTLLQGHPLNEWGYHAGKSAWPGLYGTVSDELIGIEIACAGRCKEVVVNGEVRYQAWFHKNESEYFTKDQVRYSLDNENIQKGWYQKYTKEQEDTLIHFLLWMKRNDPHGVFSFDFVLGHDEVATPHGRKNDPGASLSMTMPQLRSTLKNLSKGIKE